MSDISEMNKTQQAIFLMVLAAHHNQICETMKDLNEVNEQFLTNGITLKFDADREYTFVEIASIFELELGKRIVELQDLLDVDVEIDVIKI